MKLGKAILLVLLENVFCIMFLAMIFDIKYWGIFLSLIIGFFWLVLFSMCVIGMSEHICKEKLDDKETN